MAVTVNWAVPPGGNDWREGEGPAVTLGSFTVRTATELVIEPLPPVTQEELARARVYAALSRSYETDDSEAAARHNEHQP